MFRSSYRFVVFPLFAFIAAFVVVGCQSNAQPPAAESHPLTGIVVSLDPAKGLVGVEHEEVPGKMEAMTMLFSVKDRAELAGLKINDEISADYSITDKGATLENIKVTGAAAAKPAPTKSP